MGPELGTPARPTITDPSPETARALPWNVEGYGSRGSVRGITPPERVQRKGSPWRASPPTTVEPSAEMATEASLGKPFQKYDPNPSPRNEAARSDVNEAPKIVATRTSGSRTPRANVFMPLSVPRNRPSCTRS